MFKKCNEDFYHSVVGQLIKDEKGIFNFWPRPIDGFWTEGVMNRVIIKLKELNGEQNMNKVIVHDGRGHQDDFLAACVCAHKLNAPIYRQKYKEEDLLNPDIWVLDQGKSFDVDLHNFDHHQIEEEICAFTMVLDYFYGKSYRQFLPQLKFIEILDSYGPQKATKFAGITEESLDIVASPIYLGMMKIFSNSCGEIVDPLYSILKEIGKQICNQIEESETLFSALDDANFFTYNNVKILDTTKCRMAKEKQLPTKLYCKYKGLNPEVILTVDNRMEGYRMVSINSESLKFNPNPISYFTHNSGFLTNFVNYDQYKEILDKYCSKSIAQDHESL
jgi:hypothetical protein